MTCSFAPFSSSSPTSSFPCLTNPKKHLLCSRSNRIVQDRHVVSSFSFPFFIRHIFGIPLLLFSFLIHCINGQYSAQTYPDPRIDPFSCRLILPGQVCDPSEILNPDERRLLNEKITKLQQITANIKNSSPACTDTTRNTNLYIIVALIEKLGSLPFDARSDVNIEKFTNQLRSKYQNYQDVSLCDPLVLIVNSRSDRQVFTVAGRDAKLSREVLQAAFHRNVGHFRTGNYAMGLEGMVELIVSSYSGAHIVQTPAGDGVLPPTAQVPSSSHSMPSSSGTGQFIAHGVRQKQDKLQRIDLESVPEEDKLWTRIVVKAVAQCGDDANRLPKYVRAIVEDAMDISLKLISDSRYNKIEEDAQDPEKAPNARDKAWMALKPYFEELYGKYAQTLTADNIDQCPIQRADERLLRIVRLRN